MTQADVRRATVASLIGRLLLSTAVIAGFAACSRTDATPILTADMPLHLEDHLDAATVTGSEVSTDLYQPVEWRFDQPQAEWALTPQPRIGSPTLQPSRITLEHTADALRVTLPEENRRADNLVYGGLYIDLPGWRREDWTHILVRARTSTVRNMTIGLNPGPDPARGTFARNGGSTPIVSDGSVQTYEIRPNWGSARTGPWLRLGLGFQASEPGNIDVISVSVVPAGARYAADDVGARSVAVGGTYRRSVFTHAPGRLAYQVRVPQGGRFQTAVGVLNTPVEFRATVQPANGGPTTVWAETHADPMQWAEQTIDLSSFAGQTISLTLETSATDTGTVAFWGSPTLSGTRRTDRPNVILYIIDGGGADYMSVYGYNRRTTPNLERLAAEGAVFEHAYSTSSWTGPSTTSFMTALHASVLGGRARFDPLPEQAVTMAERFHRAGYQTAVFTSNDWAGSTSNLERGVDLLRDADVRDQSTSSVDLHAAFWDWREAYPGHPYWVHFQTTDVHEPYGSPGPPFAGMFVSPGALITLRQWQERLSDDRPAIRSDAYAEHGISRVGFYTLLQGVYDQQMAHNDYQIGRLIDRLKASGEWDNTLFIVAADHSIASAMDDLGVALLDPLPPRWSDYSVAGPMFRPTITRVPLIVVWPGHIPGDRRFTDAVSMIDVLPTVLDLTGQPMPEVMQGQSLGPLLRGAEGWTPRPVILDEFAPDPATGQLQGRLEVVDGRWGASLEIGPAAADAANRRPWPLLLYDLWSDPLCLAPVNEARPDLVAKYTTFLEEQWKAHQALATQFTPGANVALTPEQLERLRTLGYIR